MLSHSFLQGLILPGGRDWESVAYQPSIFSCPAYCGDFLKSHSNFQQGKYSMTMSWPDACSEDDVTVAPTASAPEVCIRIK